MKHPASVGELVAAAHARTRRARALEAASLALAAALASASAIELSGGGALTVAGASLEALCAALCGATWWYDHRRSAREIAERADVRLEERGALLAAFEREGGSDALPRLLASRVLATLPHDAAARAAHRASVAFAAAPLAAVALFFAAHGTGSALPRDVAALVAGASRAVARGAAVVRPNESGSSLAVFARQLDAELSRSARPDEFREVLQQARDALVAKLESSAGTESRGPELPAALDAVEAALARLSGTPGDPARGHGAGSAGSGAGSKLQNGPEQRTLSGSTPQAEPSETSRSIPLPPVRAPAIEVGTVAGRWWSAEYDAVVEAWAGER
jgi:hypothetical protein